MSNVMKPPVAVQVGSAVRAALGGLLVALISSAALAQTAGTAAPKPDAASAKQQPPPGGCMPIGVTVSGQIVFAFQCKDFLEQQKAANQDPAAAAATDKPATAEEGLAAGQEKPAPVEEKHLTVEEKTAARQPDGVVPVKLTAQPTALSAKHTERAIGPPGCAHFRSYNAAAGTYLSFDGQRYPCHEVAASQVSRK
jgi:hypothetical protein